MVYRKLFDYDNWATTRLLDALPTDLPDTDKALQLVAHIVGAKRVWLARLRHQPTEGLPIFPTWSHAQCRDAADDAHLDWSTFLDQLDPTWLAVACKYKTSRGDACVNQVGDILQHVANHATHHRAQVCTLIRERGATPPAIDFIVYCRTIPSP